MVITGAQTQAEVAEAAVTRMLASVGDRSVAELLQDLETSKAIESKLAVYQVRAAATLAALERHGDGGAGVLRHATGVSRRQAESRARTARILEEMPAAREALESGRVSFANAARLAQAAEGVEAGAVEADASLLAKAESMTDDQFAREARRWTASHQADGGEADYRRCRERRSLRMWDGDDGMTHVKGEFDPVTGERIRNRLEAEARRLRRADGAGSGGGGGGAGGGDKRGFGQAMADALDGLTDVGSGVGRIAGGAAGRGDPAGGSDGTGSPAGNNSTGGSDHSSTDSNVDGRTGSGAGDSDHGSAGNNSTGRTSGGTSTAGGAAGTRDPASRASDDHAGKPATNSAGAPARTNGTGGGSATPDDTTNSSSDRSDPPSGNGASGGSTTRGRTTGSSDGDCSCGRRQRGGRPIADIAVVSHVDSATGDLVSQLATGEPLPPSVLDLLSCNAALTGVLYDTAGTPLWQGTTKRTATAAQLKALIARDGGCIGCGCHPALCQAHHIRPVCRGGPTTVANMTLLCWHCHNKVHHNQWQVLRRNGRLVLEPPIRTRWGPARAP
ncbi:MAG: DUF222 domain-containing protein [Acidimicrobiaceae bacterium]|nr:DUF222 domain-containing protein [Acidimicrobiaceae bacterium]MYL03182.1 DUF222 domain-containing protein [Acidimicrobiaceae bacterium]